MKDLDSFIKSNRKYVSIQDGETFKGIYQGFKIVADRFNPGKETVAYMFQVPGSQEMLPWTKASPKIALQMKKFGVGDVLEITRFGEGTDTKYHIRASVNPLEGLNNAPVSDTSVPF